MNQSSGCLMAPQPSSTEMSTIIETTSPPSDSRSSDDESDASAADTLRLLRHVSASGFNAPGSESTATGPAAAGRRKSMRVSIALPDGVSGGASDDSAVGAVGPRETSRFDSLGESDDQQQRRWPRGASVSADKSRDAGAASKYELQCATTRSGSLADNGEHGVLALDASLERRARQSSARVAPADETVREVPTANRPHWYLAASLLYHSALSLLGVCDAEHRLQ
jgi:hypothetical protein